MFIICQVLSVLINAFNSHSKECKENQKGPRFRWTGERAMLWKPVTAMAGHFLLGFSAWVSIWGPNPKFTHPPNSRARSILLLAWTLVPALICA